MKKVLTATHVAGEAFDVATVSGQSIRVEGASAGLDASGPGPMQLLLVGLATCSAINVIDLLNKSRDDVAYNLIDLEEQPDQGLLDAICAIDSVINVRVISGTG